jgi:hypothetical protein
MEEFTIGAIILSLLMTVGWTIFNFPQKLLSWLSLLLIAVILAIISAALITNLGSVHFILTDTLFYPMICVWVLFFSSIIFNFFDVKGKDIIFWIAFASGLFLLLFGFELVKISVNTWKSLFPAMAFLQVLTAVLTLQAITYLSPVKTNYGTLKLLTGIISFAVISLQYLDLLPPIKSDADIFINNTVIFASAVLIIEGLLLIYKARKELTQRKL